MNLVDNIIESVDNISDEMVKHAFMFDFYKNEKTNEVKLGYRFVFQSKEKTLSDKEINKKIQEIINPIIRLDGVTIPGM